MFVIYSWWVIDGVREKREGLLKVRYLVIIFYR